MRVILIRHGDAIMSSPLGDSGRHLSIEGRRQAEATGRALASHEVRPTRVWSSPLVRAVQTTELVLAALRYEGVVEARDDLFPDSSFEPLVRSLARLDGDSTVIVIGHQPYMSTITSSLLGASGSDLATSGFATGAAYCLRVAGLFPHRVELEWRWPGA